MKSQLAFFREVSLSLSLTTVCGLMACGGSSSSTTPPPPPPKTTKYVAVYDRCRVMIFDTPTSTGMNASLVLGEDDFIHSCTNWAGPLGPAEQNGLGSVFEQGGDGVVFDSSGNIYIADTAENRVLQFVPPFSDGMNASTVLGQPDFTTTSWSSSASGLISPQGLAFDASGDLWVTDNGNDRIVEYKPPFSSGMAPVIEYGATDTGGTGTMCNDAAFGATNNGFCGPYSLAVDTASDLWVTDVDYNRVLEFTPPFSKDMKASLELGHAAGPTAFTANQSNDGGSVSAIGLSRPAGIQFDSHGNLWVADTGNNRVLGFVPPFTNGMGAAFVLGQTDLIHNLSSPISQSSLSAPASLALDSSGELLVSDSGNNRVLIFSPPFTTGMSATAVLGSLSFTSAGTGDVSQSTLSAPLGVATF